MYLDACAVLFFNGYTINEQKINKHIFNNTQDEKRIHFFKSGGMPL